MPTVESIEPVAQDIEPASGKSRFLRWWNGAPLYLRILGALALGIVAGLLLGKQAAPLAIPSRLILRLLGALAPPLILLAVIRSLLTANLSGRTARRMAGYLLLNTLVAILIGLTVANTLRPGRFAHLAAPSDAPKAASAARDPVSQFTEQIPDSLLKPLVENNVIGVIIIAVAFGIAFRRKLSVQPRIVDWIELLFGVVVTVLHWIIALVPLGVFGIVASIVGTRGFADFHALGMFVAAVIAALLLQAAWYLARIGLGTWVTPARLLRGGRDALVMAFSTASSTATMPVTYERLRDRVGLRDESASMGALVGSNFNNDGTALYEAMSALFVSQMLGMDLGIGQQLVVVLTSIVASVGAAGIPEAGLVTMTLVFTAVRLPIGFIAVLLTVDWFLDRCRTAINVMGDMNVACLLDGRTPMVPTREAPVEP